MNSNKVSRFVARVAGALAMCSVLIQPALAGSTAAGSSLPFAATTAHCRAEETHGWSYPGSYFRGQNVVCDLLSDEVLVKGKLTLQQACPINGSVCTATFRIVTDTGARWEGAYWTEADGGQLVLRGAGLGDQAGMQIVFNLNNLMSVSGWVDESSDDNVMGRIIAAN